MSGTNTRALLKRITWSLFFALVACGITFYLIMFLGLMVEVFARGVNPANAPVLNETLRRVALPASLVLGVVVLVFAMRRKEREEPRQSASKDDRRTGRVLIK